MTELTSSRWRQAGLVRSVVRRSRSDWPLVLAAWLLLACSTSLITAAATYSESVALGGFHRMLEASSPATSAVRVHASVAATALAQADSAVAPAIAATLGAGNGRTQLIATTASLSLAGVDASDGAHQIVVGSYDGIEAHATLVTGRWATAGAATTEATLSVGAATALGVSVGEGVRLTSKLSPSLHSEILIVGLWRADITDRYWLGSGLELTGVQTTGTTTTRGPFVVAGRDLPAMTGDVGLDVEWRWLPAIGDLRPAQADSLAAAVASLGEEAQNAYPDTYVWSESGLPDTLHTASRSLLVTQSSVLLLFAQFAVLAIYAVLLVAGMLVERRRPESALLRSRGASSGNLAVLALGESLLLAVPAVAVAPFVAQAVVRLLGAIGPLAAAGVLAPVGVDATAVAAAVGAGIGCVIVLTLPALPGTGTLSGVRAALSRQVGRTLAQRLGLDLALLVVAAIAIWQLQLYGAPLTRTVRGDLGIDPLLVAAPAIGLLAGALFATRAVPRIGELGERLMDHNRGLMAPLLARQIGRRPLRYTRLALLLMLAASFGTFAATFAATWTRSQSDQAAYQVAADERVTVTDHPILPEWALGAAYTTIPGVRSASPVIRVPLTVGRDVSNGLFLAVDPAATAGLASFPAGTFSGSPSEALAGLNQSPGSTPLEIPGRPTRLAVTVDTALVDNQAGTVLDGQAVAGPSAAYVRAAVVVADAHGLHRFEGGQAGLSAGSVRLTIDLTATVGGTLYVPSYPLRLEAVELELTDPNYGQISGNVELKAVDEGDASSDAWQPVGLQIGAPDWTWGRVSRQTATPYEAPAGHPGLISIGDATDQTPTVSIEPPTDNGTTFRYMAPQTGPTALPAIADSALLDATGARVGDTLLASRYGFESPVRIVGTAASFPTLDPALPFLVVDRAALELTDYATWGIVDSAGEWWFGVDPGRGAEVATTLSGGPYSAASIVDRAQLESSLLGDPITLGVIGALGLGSIAAIALAAIGFLVTVAFLTRERAGELALLRALGQSTRGVVGMLAVEEAFLLAYGMIAGAALGLLLGWLSIPFTSVTSTGAAAIPAPSIVVPWQTILLIGLPVVAGLAVGAVALIRVAAGGGIAASLRGREVEP
jgi:hypothetical protein